MSEFVINEFCRQEDVQDLVLWVVVTSELFEPRFLVMSLSLSMNELCC